MQGSSTRVFSHVLRVLRTALEVSRGEIKHSVTDVPLVSRTVYKRSRPSYENVYLVLCVLVSFLHRLSVHQVQL